jgi:hypothetical protein
MNGYMCEVSEKTRGAIQQSECEANKKLSFEVTTTVHVSPSTSSHERRLLMGHGLQIGRSVTALDDAVKAILETQFQSGVTESSNRKCVLEMEECAKTMPTLTAPAIHKVNSWLSGRLGKRQEIKRN